MSLAAQQQHSTATAQRAHLQDRAVTLLHVANILCDMSPIQLYVVCLAHVCAVCCHCVLGLERLFERSAMQVRNSRLKRSQFVCKHAATDRLVRQLARDNWNIKRQVYRSNSAVLPSCGAVPENNYNSLSAYHSIRLLCSL
jgi:hypothetical protein